MRILEDPGFAAGVVQFLESLPNQIGCILNAWMCVHGASRVDSTAPAE